MAETNLSPVTLYLAHPPVPFITRPRNISVTQGIKFKAVDVSRDPVAARDMVRRVGQQRVLIRDIGGKVVVSFDRPKIDKYLGI
jgi:glutaredoxin 3